MKDQYDELSEAEQFACVVSILTLFNRQFQLLHIFYGIYFAKISLKQTKANRVELCGRVGTASEHSSSTGCYSILFCIVVHFILFSLALVAVSFLVTLLRLENRNS